MSLDIGVGKSWDDPALFKEGGHLSFESDGYYWFLYKYFENANLDPAHELIDLYGGNEIEGYELERLEEELNAALNDIQWRDNTWEVVTGWNGESKTKEAEIKREVSKTEMSKLIKNLLVLISESKRTGRKLVCLGD